VLTAAAMPINDNRAMSRRRRISLALTAFVVVAAAVLVVVEVAGGGNRPSVSALSIHAVPDRGGSTVVIRGRDFLACNTSEPLVTFGGNPSSGGFLLGSRWHVVSGSEIVATAPPSYPGRVFVQVHNGCGWSRPGPANTLTFLPNPRQCRVGTCDARVGATAANPLRHTAMGFLNGYVGATPPQAASWMDKLHPRSWRYTVLTPGMRQLVTSTGARTMALLESRWMTCVTCGDVHRPWDSLAALARNYSAQVRAAVASGTAPTYWDIWNEPDGSGTVRQWLSVYLTAYRAIVAAQPDAKVVGPDIAAFSVAPPATLDAPGYRLDLRTFLEFATSHGMRLAAVTYHDEGAPAGGVDLTPADLRAHAAETRQLLDRYPTLESAAVFVDEYGPADAESKPGWLVGMIAALDGSAADEATLTCADVATCQTTIDGLLGPDGTPQMPYWVYSDYAAMSGVRLSVTGAAPNVSVIAARARDGTLRALVGRHDECGRAPRPFIGAAAPPDTCRASTPANATAVSLDLTVELPSHAHALTVSVQRLADGASAPVGRNPVPAPPAATTMTAAASGGLAHIVVPGVRDGDAVSLTARPLTPGKR
jgi:hypothetical protein